MKDSTNITLTPPRRASQHAGLKLWLSPGIWITLLLVLLVGLLPVITGNAATREVIFTMLLSVVLATNLNIILGYTGYVSFGHVVFFGIGGYTGLFMLSQYNAPIWLALFAGGLVAGTLAFLVGKAILRLRGAYFALATIGINEAMRAFVGNFPPFGAATGISLNFGIYQDYGGAAQALWMTYILLLGLALFSVILSYLIKTSKFGLSLLTIREDEDAAEVIGVTTPNAKTWSYVISAIIPGMVGVLFFFKNGNIEPAEAFRLNTSIETIVMVMLGGQGTVLGPVLGAAGYQRLRGFLLTNPLFKDIQLSVAGLLLLLIILFIPSGAVGWLRKRFPRLRKVLQ
ncbi:MAG: branched-chain amino acid ABC transporter permease [Chloroflexi bacterium]|nr:MAG: branched-chain amino acid ABC transporter permease [Chloroflexota bacterium]